MQTWLAWLHQATGIPCRGIPVNEKPHLPRIALIGCGGTISSLGTSALDLMDYPEHGAKLDINEVLDRIPELRKIADIVAAPFHGAGSTSLVPRDWLSLRALIRRIATEQPDPDGFVIVHGTASLEETAFFLNLTLDVPHTVVLVGAQRPLSAVGTDASMNLIEAVRVAANPSSRGRGVLVVLNDEIHAARDVVKSSTLRLDTFRSADFGALGVVDADGIHYYRRVEQPHAPDTAFAALTDDAQIPRVDIVYSYVGADATFIEAAIAKGARGIVSAGFAPGIPAHAEKAALEEAMRQGVAVVQCTRAARGRVARRRYLEETGIIAGEDFSPQKARILLALGLAMTSDVETLKEWFRRY